MAEERSVVVYVKAVMDEFVRGFKQGMAEATSESKKAAATIEKDFSGLEKSIKSFGAGVGKLGAYMSASLTPALGLIAKQSIQDFNEAERAIADVRAAIESTGGAAGKSADDLAKWASAAQFESLYQDEEILKSLTANLLTFKNITGDTFDEAQQAAIDMSARLGQDLKSSAIQLGKALNDPVSGLTALRRVGIQFTDDQEEMIKKLVKTGDLLSAQKMILAEVNSQFAGSAAAQREAGGTATIDDFNKSMGELREVWGGVLTEVMKPMIETLTSVVNWFRELSPETQKFVVVAGMIAAALGPVLAILGPLIMGLSALAPAFAALASPVGLVVAAIAAVSVALNAMGVTFEEQWNAIVALFQGAVEQIRLTFQLFTQIFSGDFAGALETLKALWNNTWSTLGNVIEALFPGLIESITGFFTNLGTTISTKVMEIVTWFTQMKDQVVAIVTQMVEAITEKLVGGLQYAWDAVASGLQSVKDSFNSAYMYIVGGSVVPDMVSEIGAHMQTLKGENLVDPAKEATNEVASLFSSLADTVKSYISDFIKTGKFDIEGFMADISSKLIDWGLDMLFKNLLGGLGGGGGGLLGGLFAEGGNPPLNKPSIVGENGPELFIPRQRGTVISNKQSADMLNGAANYRRNGGGGGRQIVNNVNVYAKDIDSFKASEIGLGRKMRRYAEIGERGT